MTLAFCALCISGKLFFLQGPGSPGSQGLDPLVAAPLEQAASLSAAAGEKAQELRIKALWSRPE